MKAIMIMFDSLNRRFLEPYGCRETITPNFLRLAQKTVRFENSYAGSLPCIPARRELHTGRYNFCTGPGDLWSLLMIPCREFCGSMGSTAIWSAITAIIGNAEVQRITLSIPHGKIYGDRRAIPGPLWLEAQRIRTRILPYLQKDCAANCTGRTWRTGQE